MKTCFLALYRLFFFAAALAAVMACSNDSDDNNGGGNSSGNVGSSSSGSVAPPIGAEWPFDSSGENLQESPGLESMNLQNVITIKYNNGNAPDITNPFSEAEIVPNGENVTVTTSGTTEYNFVLSGTAQNGSFKVYGDARLGLYLNGVNITNNSGPAINIQNGKRVSVHLVHGTNNLLTDGPSYQTLQGEEQAKGAFFSEGTLSVSGSGSLEVKGKNNHAIVTDEHFEVENGTIIVNESKNDCIHANNKIEVRGGILKLACVGDAIQNERIGQSVKILGGKIAAQTSGIKSHGIASESPVTIDGQAIVQINVLGNGSKGIRSRNYVEILNGNIAIKTTGGRHITPASERDPSDPDTTSNAAGIRVSGESNSDFFVEGGKLAIKSSGEHAKGINIDGSMFMKTGELDVEAYGDVFKIRGNLSIDGGSVKAKSRSKDCIDVSGTKTGESFINDSSCGF